MIRINVHTRGDILENSLQIEEISDALKHPSDLLWVDVLEPTATELEWIHKEFAFHPLAMEDVALLHQRPKVDLYDDYVLIIFYGLREVAVSSDGAVLAQLGIFVGSNYVVTVHNERIPALDETSARWCRNFAQLETHNAGLLVHSILDAIVDSYFPVIDNISDRLDELEERIFDTFNAETQKEVFNIKKQLVTLRRNIAPERDVMNVLLRHDIPIFEQPIVAYFQDVYDHILRVTDAIDTHRDLLASTLDVHLTVASNRLNQAMKTLTASSIILMGMTLIASIYGMNFIHIPELDWRLGYAWALGLMMLIGGSLVVLFRRIDWL